tara:strand:- start:397 stop:693 length:297 start_codon:yes stop_codon:yes gene_type:complete
MVTAPGRRQTTTAATQNPNTITEGWWRQDGSKPAFICLWPIRIWYDDTSIDNDMSGHSPDLHSDRRLMVQLSCIVAAGEFLLHLKSIVFQNDKGLTHA